VGRWIYSRKRHSERTEVASALEEMTCMFGKGTSSLPSEASKRPQNLNPFAKIKQCPLVRWKQNKVTRSTEPLFKMTYRLLSESKSEI